jgi:Fe-S cluster biogenesis protein NfuA
MNPQDHPLYPRVESALESIRSYLQADGGDVRIHHIDSDGAVELELLGSCATCSMIETTMKLGVEQTIRRAVPEVTAVRTLG